MQVLEILKLKNKYIFKGSDDSYEPIKFKIHRRIVEKIGYLYIIFNALVFVSYKTIRNCTQTSQNLNEKIISKS